MRPPAKDAAVPCTETPPFVPGGTGLNVVISHGEDFAKTPISDASVSPKQQAKCLEDIDDNLTER